MSVIIGPQIGEVVKDGKVVSKQFVMWCKYCVDRKFGGKILDKEDGKYLKKVEMKDWSYADEDGLEVNGKFCPKCHQSVTLKND